MNCHVFLYHFPRLSIHGILQKEVCETLIELRILDYALKH